MWYVLCYDIRDPGRLSRTLKTCRRYLNHVQYSTFEGELSEGQMARLRSDLRNEINEDIDSVLIYCFGEKRWESRLVLGVNPLDHVTFV